MDDPALSFDQLTARYLPALRRLARGYEGRAEEQEDLLQEILVALHRALPSFAWRSSLATWVFRVAHNTAIDHVRRASRDRLDRCVSLEELEAAPAMVSRPDLEGMIDRQAQLERLASLVRALRPADRQLILLHLEGLDPAAIAEITGISRENVATRALRIRRALAASLLPRGS